MTIERSMEGTLNTSSNDQPEHTSNVGDPAGRPLGDLDFPTLGRLVETEARDLADRASFVNEEIVRLTTDYEWARTHAGFDGDTTGSAFADRLTAEINSIGANAYRLARHVRTLIEFRDIDLAVRTTSGAPGS
jgi:hypothetical protein